MGFPATPSSPPSRGSGMAHYICICSCVRFRALSLYLARGSSLSANVCADMHNHHAGTPTSKDCDSGNLLRAGDTRGFRSMAKLLVQLDAT